MISSDKLQFITETLKQTAEAVVRLKGRKAEYTDVKGYLAEADLLSHDVITSAIRSQWASDDVHSEESQTGQSLSHRKGARTWILDPICGTTNYVRGIPFYAHSICVLDDDGVLAAGIYHPSMDELFLADRKQTTVNGRIVRVSETSRLDLALIDVNCNQSAYQNDEEQIVGIVKKLAPPATRRLRIMESANLEMAYVACGRIDGYVNPDDKVWDIAAGSLMIASAGGFSELQRGSIHQLSQCRGVFAANKYLFNALKSVFRN